MKNRITKTFLQLKKSGQKAFVPFLTAGYPDSKSTVALARTLSESGAHVLELGMPFSDPMADGPVIQKAGEVALKKGITIKKIFQIVRDIRRHTEIPIVLMGYLNPLWQYGLENFAKDAAKAGVDGLLIVDCPLDESQDLLQISHRHGLELIPLITPVTPAERIRRIAKKAGGYLYYVSYTGITGAKNLDVPAVKQHVKNIRSLTQMPILVGFGINTAQDVRALASAADGVIVGSALLRLIGKHRGSQGIQAVRKFTKDCTAALSVK